MITGFWGGVRYGIGGGVDIVVGSLVIEGSVVGSPDDEGTALGLVFSGEVEMEDGVTRTEFRVCRPLELALSVATGDSLA